MAILAYKAIKSSLIFWMHVHLANAVYLQLQSIYGVCMYIYIRHKHLPNKTQVTECLEVVTSLRLSFYSTYDLQFRKIIFVINEITV